MYTETYINPSVPMIFSIPLNSIYNRHTTVTYLLLYIYIYISIKIFVIGPSFSRCFLRPGSCEETGLSTDERRLHGGHHGGHVGGLGPGGSAVDQRHGWQHHSNVWQLGQPCCRAAPPPNHFLSCFGGMVKATIFGCGCCGCGCCGCGCGGCGCGGCGGCLRHHKRGHGHGPMFSVFSFLVGV